MPASDFFIWDRLALAAYITAVITGAVIGWIGSTLFNMLLEIKHNETCWTAAATLECRLKTVAWPLYTRTIRLISLKQECWKLRVEQVYNQLKSGLWTIFSLKYVFHCHILKNLTHKSAQNHQLMAKLWQTKWCFHVEGTLCSELPHPVPTECDVVYSFKRNEWHNSKYRPCTSHKLATWQLDFLHFLCLKLPGIICYNIKRWVPKRLVSRQL